MTTLNANGRSERKSLASQLDRLDRILDGLADGLNEAVAQAVKEAVVAAVEAAVRELLASAELQRRLHPQPVDRPALVRRAAVALGCGLVGAAKRCWGWVTALVGRGRDKVAHAVATVREGREELAGRVRRRLSEFARRVWLAGSVARRFRRVLLVALLSGLVVGLGCYLAGPAVASAVSGLAGFAGTLAAGLLARLRRVLRRAALQEWYVGRLP